MKKTVIKLNYNGKKGKQKVMKVVASVSGISEISVEENKMTVVGDVDPIKLVEKLRKVCNADIDTTGPSEEKKEPKKEEPKKEEPKKEEPKKEENDPKKEEEKMIKHLEEMANACKSFDSNRHRSTYYIVHTVREEPNSCVVS